MSFDRRLFLKGLGIIPASIILEKIPFNRVWSFPNKIVIPKLKRGVWKIEDDWTDAPEAYSVIYNVVEMPEDNGNWYKKLPMIQKFDINYAYTTPPEYKQIAEQIIKGMNRQSERITFDVLSKSNFRYSGI